MWERASRHATTRLVTSVMAIVTLSLIPSPASANIADLTIQTGCSQDPSYTGVLKLSAQTYDAYVRFAKRGEIGTVTGYTQPYNNGSLGYGCESIGTVEASGDRWTKLGNLTISSETEQVVEIASPVLGGVPDANRPSVLLLPSNNPPCIPTDECHVTVDGNSGYVRPVGTLLNQDSLHVVQVKSSDQDTVKQVRYYADNKLMYTTKTLEPFDMRYVSYQGQSLARVIEYHSGQQVILPASSSITHADTLGNFIFRLSQSYPVLFKIIIGGISVTIVASILSLLMSRYRDHQNWRIAHGFREAKLSIFDRVRYGLRASKWYGASRAVIIAGVILVPGVVAVAAFDRYMATIFYVDGHSMEKTYFTGDAVLVNRVPRTLAAFNNGEYIPKRGDVVVVRMAFGNSLLDSQVNTSPTLIKRVLALPGERVVVKDGVLMVYNKEHPDGFSPDETGNWKQLFTADLPTEHIELQLDTNELFVSGDNRPESIDSRFNGPIATKEVIGTVATKLW